MGCPDCETRRTCPDCRGEGKVVYFRTWSSSTSAMTGKWSPGGSDKSYKWCEQCKGGGFVHSVKYVCWKCKGSGKIGGYWEVEEIVKRWPNGEYKCTEKERTWIPKETCGICDGDGWNLGWAPCG